VGKKRAVFGVVALTAGLPVPGSRAHAQSSDYPVVPRSTISDLPQPLEPPTGIHEHDGLYVRLATGPSVLHASWKDRTDDLSLTGIGLALAMAFGVSVTPNLVIYGEVTGSVVKDPIRNRNGVSTTRTGHDLSLAGIGPGAAYYLLPAHLYFSGTLTLSYLARGYYGVSSGSEGSGGNGAILTNRDIGGTFMVGKEWWVSANWGLGVAGIVHIASMKLPNTDSRATAEALSLVLSATYN
jgi:hypothetical protein